MCTAVTLKTQDFYFGRTLDYEFSYKEHVTITPRNFPLQFRNAATVTKHYAMIGMAHIADQYPLYYDAVNEKGLTMAGLNFPGNARYGSAVEEQSNIAYFEFIPWVLCQCANIADARQLLKTTNLTDNRFSSQYPIAPLHWIVADRSESITVEPIDTGLKIWENPIGILTNNPQFDQQMLNLRNYMHLSPHEPQSLFAPDIQLTPYSRGMGAIGLPGDLSSPSRFVRAAFTKLNSICGSSESDSVSQFFHILSTVSQTRGCCRLNDNQNEITIYSSCCNADKGVYYYTSYDVHQISAVNMHKENLNSSELIYYPLNKEERVYLQN